MSKVQIYDTTLRDGAQGPGVSFSVEDKVKVALKLDELGVDFIEAGYPGASDSEKEVFNRLRAEQFTRSRLVAFGSTRLKNSRPEDSKSLTSIVESGAEVATIFGKSWTLHIYEVLKTTLEENLRMIEDSIRFLRAEGMRVFFDAEHYFDAYLADRDYALETLRVAKEAGAETIVLCDTRGGTLTDEFCRIFGETIHETDTTLGVHTHNDSGVAVANSIHAVRLGAVQVQGTMNGYGERCGNANLCTIIPVLSLKLGIDTIPSENLIKLTETARFISEVANLPMDERQPFVGGYAFAHKGGMHSDGVVKRTDTFEHIDPSLVGNLREIIISQLAGRAAVLESAKLYKADIDKDHPIIGELLAELEARSAIGYEYEDAEGSFELLIMKRLGNYQQLFERCGFRVTIDRREDGSIYSEATIKIRVGDKTIHTAADGNGPVDALDKALRKALLEIYPDLKNISLIDYKVRVLNSEAGTAAKVRVFIESTDHHHKWGTVGASENIIEASWQALLDSIDYGLQYKRARKKPL